MRPLPILAAAIHALNSVRNNLGFAFHLSWPWLLLVIPLNVWGEISFVPVDPATADQAALEGAAQGALVFLCTSLFSIVAMSSIAVSWHRYILLDEVPHGWNRLRLDGVVWSYVGNSLLIGLLLMLASLPLSFIFGAMGAAMGGLSNFVLGAYVIATVIVVLPLAYRLSLKLPALSVGNDKLTLKECWELTIGNSVPLALLGMIFIGALLLLSLLLAQVSAVVAPETGSAVDIAMTTLRQVISWVVTLVTVTTLTSLYGFFVEKRSF